MDGERYNIGGREFEYLYTGAINQKLLEILNFNGSNGYFDLTEQQCFQLFAMSLHPIKTGDPRLGYDDFIRIPPKVFDQIKKNLWQAERNANILKEYSENVKTYNDLLKKTESL